jgi:1,4-dihydroxy-2-naphthoate octaprenyltransferase
MVSKIKIFFLETRPHFLVLSVILALLGSAIARYLGAFHLPYAILCLAGILLLHASTNVLNDYFDFRSGIDLNTRRTPFSGGSGIINSGAMTPGQAFWFGLICFFLAVPIGAYFVLTVGFKLLPLFITGAFFVLLGTSHLFRAGMAVAEIAAGLGLGTLPVLGTAWILQGRINPGALYASIPSGILVGNLLFLNEFPDAEADRKGGRKTLAILLGLDKAARVYGILTAIVYAWILLGVVTGIMPAFSLLSLLTLPLAIKAVKGSRVHTDPAILTAAQGANTGMILGTQALLALAYFLAG